MATNPNSYQFDLPAAGRPSDTIIEEFWYPGVQSYWKNASAQRSVDAILGIRAIVIHATAGSSSAGAISVIKAGSASFHWLVPDEDEPQHGQFVWACIPEARAAWHVRRGCRHSQVNGGATSVNQWSLGIEVVNNQKPTDPFSQWQLEATAAIVRYCWAKYPNLRHVVSHAKLDPGRRSDPGVHFDWPRFKQLVLHGSGAQLPDAFDAATHASRIPTSTSNESCCL